ncbi:hypothetical protein [Nonomuraea turcica]|uniref:hypothetical protein n=1 Tax=Nonomuraea sp. G32 TaxID=3067274 RepID=UPI00273BFE02|nr:hypothetical protein [Nonomuraea sp. G32]MDP4503282.1 hypothetical protein [Nonomuraea sp. G32]
MSSEPDGFSTAETLGNEPPRRRFPRSLLLAGTTAVVLVAGAGVAAAAAFSPSPSPTPTATGTAAPSASPSGTPSDQAPGRDRGWGRKMGFGGMPLHGEYVVKDGTGAYVTVASQYGDVTAVDQDSITVKSEDGYTKEYVVNADTRINRGSEGVDAVTTGEKVMVTAKVDGGTATAVAIHEAALRDGQGWRGKGGRWHGDHRPGQPPTSSPSPSSSPSSSPTTTS